MKVLKLDELKHPLRFTTKSPITLELTSDRGRLWVNDDTHCVLRICMLPDDTVVTYNEETGYLDLTFPT